MLIKTVSKNILSLSLSSIASKIFALLITVALARHYGPETFGYFAAAMAFAGTLTVFMNFGIRPDFIYTGTKHSEDIPAYLGNSLLVLLSTSVITLIIGRILSIQFYSTGILIDLIFLFLVFNLFKTVLNILNAVFYINNKMHINALFDITEYFLSLIAVIIIIFSDKDITLVPLIKIFIIIILILFSFLVLRKYTTIKFTLLKTKDILSSSVWFLFSGIFYTIYFQIDIIMLSMMKTATEVGYYSSVYKLMVPFFILPGVISKALKPTIFKEFNNYELIKNIHIKTVKLTASISILITYFIVFYSKQIIVIFYGTEYLPAMSVILILAWHIPLRFVIVSSGDIVTAAGLQQKRTYFQCCAAVVNILANIILIQKFGIKGAAIATILSESVLLSLYTLYIKKIIDIFVIPKALVIPLTIIVTFLLISFHLKFNNYFYHLIPIFFGMLYMMILFYIKYFDKEDILLLKKPV